MDKCKMKFEYSQTMIIEKTAMRVIGTINRLENETTEIKFDGYSKLKLTFTLPLKKTVNLQGNNTLDIRHEDATASVIIYYDKPELLSIDSNLKSNCKADIKEKKNFEEGESPQTVKIVCKT